MRSRSPPARSLPQLSRSVLVPKPRHWPIVPVPSCAAWARIGASPCRRCGSTQRSAGCLPSECPAPGDTHARVIAWPEHVSRAGCYIRNHPHAGRQTTSLQLASITAAINIDLRFQSKLPYPWLVQFPVPRPERTESPLLRIVSRHTLCPRSPSHAPICSASCRHW